jgi:hypothetical protein
MYGWFTVVHNKETFTTSGTSTVSADATTIITGDSNNLGSYIVVYTMTDTSDSQIYATYSVNLVVIEDVCSPNMITTNLNHIAGTTYDYTIGDSALQITGLEDFTCGDCQSESILNARVKSAGVETFREGDTDYATLTASGRTYTAVEYHSNMFTMDSKGTITLEIQTNDLTLAEIYRICLDFEQTGISNSDKVIGNGDGKNYFQICFDVNIAAHCLSTWALPTAYGYDGSEFVIDIASSSTLTIDWTPDD